MKFELITFDELFDHPLEEIVEQIDNYLNGLIKIRPDAVLRVETVEESAGKAWKGYLEEPKEWGKDDVVYGHIEIIPLFIDCVSPMQVKLFCNDPKFLTYWAGLANTLVKNLKLSDGSPPPTVEPWTLIPDKNNDRTILKLWIEGWDAKKIGRELDGSHRTVYDRLRLLRKEYGEDIVPKHRKP